MANLIDFLEDLNKKFFRCNICLDQLRQPTQLPCLHRFCRECLRQAFSAAATSAPARCPVCRDHFTKTSFNDLKCDFFTQQIIEFCGEKERSVKNDRHRKCLRCSSEQRAQSYCFRCNGFLCEGCSSLHSSGGAAKVHFTSMLNIQTFLDLTAEGMDILARIQLSQSCKANAEKVTKLKSDECRNRSVRGICTRGDCKGCIAPENIEDAVCNAYKHLKKKMDHLQSQMGVNLQKFESAITFHKEVLQSAERIIDKLKMNSLGQSGSHDQALPTTEEGFGDIKEQRQAVINYLKKVVKVQKRNITKLNTFEKSWQMQCNKLKEAVNSFSSARHECRFSFVFGEPLFSDVIDKIVSQGSSHHSATGYPSNYNLAFSSSKNKGCFGVLHVSSSLEMRVCVDHIDSRVSVCSVTSSRDGRLFQSGYTNDGLSQITQTTVKGRELGKKEFQGTLKRPRRVVAFYKRGTVVSACQQDELGMFNAIDGTYFSRNLKNLVPNWSMKNWITCVAVDRSRNEIIVGSVHQSLTGDDAENISLEIFNPKLEHLRTLPIPSTKGAIDICSMNGVIVVCDLWGRNVFTIDMNGRLMCRFSGPRVNDLQCAPRSVCTDSVGYVYVLWECNVDGSLHKLVMQSTPDGHPLTIRKVDSDSKSITIAKSENGEAKLVVVTYKSRQMHVYSIVDDEEAHLPT